MTGPTTDLDALAIAGRLPAELASSWSTAVATLTERELSAVVMRFGFVTGKPESFGAIGRELGVNRVRAHAIFRNAIQRLGGLDETRALARYLADLNAVLSEEEPVERSRQPVPPIEDTDGEASEGDADDDAPEPVRDVPVHDDASAGVAAPNDDADRADSADDNDTVDQHEPADQDEVVADEPVSEKQALKLVLVADGELALAIERCAGREDLMAELQRARTRIAAGLREIEREAPVASATASASTGKRRGRPENVEQTARRVAVLARVQVGEISNAEAAKEVGISYAAWSAWKSIHGKRNGVIVPAAMVRVAPTPVPTGKRRRGRPSDPVETARRAAVLKRVQAGELSNTEAAAELGLTPGAWAGWKSYYQKRHDVIVPAPTVRAAPTPDVTELAARLARVEHFGAELRRRVRDLVAFVEERGPG